MKDIVKFLQDKNIPTVKVTEMTEEEDGEIVIVTGKLHVQVNDEMGYMIVNEEVYVNGEFEHMQTYGTQNNPEAMYKKLLPVYTKIINTEK